MTIFSKYKLGFGLALFVIVFFLIVTHLFLSETYYNNSIFINAFIIPFIFIGSLLYFLLQYKKQNHNVLRFGQVFQYSYFNLFIGFFLSISFIVAYMNFVQPDIKNIFNYQFHDSFYQNAKKDIEAQEVLEFQGMTKENSKKYAQELLHGLKEKRDHLSENIMSFSNTKLLGFIFTINLFYLLISVFLSLFLRTKTPN